MRLIRNVVAGAVAGAIGTPRWIACCTSATYTTGEWSRSGSGNYAAGVKSWDEASAPGKVGQKAFRAITGEEPPDEWARPTTNFMHWATGVGWGIQSASSPRRRRTFPGSGPRHSVRPASLAAKSVLPFLKVYRPIWDYHTGTLGQDLSAHMVFGSVTSAAFAALTRS